MADFTWVGQMEELTPAALTVRAQTIDPTDDSRLMWSTIMPRQDVETTKLADMTVAEYRLSSDRREWNQRGRYIPLFTPPTKELEWVPIESYGRIEEKEINDLLNNVRGNQQIFREVISARLPARTDQLILANWRRLEIDVFDAWSKGSFSATNPQTGRTYSIDYPMEKRATRYTTASWSSDPYDKLIVWLQKAYETIGPMAGIMLNLKSRNAIVADAPNPTPGVLAGIKPSVRLTEERIQDETGRPFRFFINENTLDTFDDGGTTRTTRKLWPADIIAAVPAGISVGTTAFAPVLRAYDISSQTPDAGIDIRGQTVYHEIGNAGRELIIEAQFNPFPIPNEERIYVIDAGIGA